MSFSQDSDTSSASGSSRLTAVSANRGHFSQVLLVHNVTLDLLESTMKSEKLKTVATVGAKVPICERSWMSVEEN